MSWDPVRAIAAELEELGWSGRDLARAAAGRFGCTVATAETWWYRLHSGQREHAEWSDRFLIALDLHEPVDEAARPGLDAWCPRCREVVATAADGRCSWCSAQTGGNVDLAPHQGRSNAGVPYLMDEETLLEARRLYLQGLGFLRVAREIHRRTAYASTRALAVSLHKTFHQRGWATRDRHEATVGTHTVHGRAPKHGPRPGYKAFLRHRAGLARPRCAGTLTSLSGGGRPCRRPAAAGSEFCASHDPARAAERAAHLASVRDRAVRARWAA